MGFDEVDLYRAVHRVYTSIETPARERVSDGDRLDLIEMVTVEMIRMGCDPGVLPSADVMHEAFIQYRKQPKLRLKIEVGEMHGWSCFYAGRGLGECDGKIDLERIVPEARGGEYSVENCVLACARHNRSRGDKTIEAFVENGEKEPGKA